MTRRHVLVATVATLLLGSAGMPPNPVAEAAGATFDPRPGSTSFGTASAFPSVVASGNGRYHAVARVDWFGHYIQHRLSENGGISWQTTAMLTSPDGGATRPRVAADGDTIAITFIGGYCTAPGQCSEAPFLAVSTDGGRHFRGPVRLDSHAFDAAVAVAGSAVWVAWERGSFIEIRGTTDAGATFPVSRTEPSVGYGVDLAAAGGGVVIAWNTFPGPRAIVGRGGVLGAVQELAGQGTSIPQRGSLAMVPSGAAHVVLQTPTGITTRTALPGTTAFRPQVDVYHGRAVGSISARDGLVAVGVGTPNGTALVSTSTDGASFSSPVPVAAMTGTPVFAGVTVAKRSTDRPHARFDWTVPAKYVKDGAGRRAPAAGAGDGLLTVELDGCASMPPDGGSIAEYRWTVGGSDLDNTHCSASIEVADGDTTEVRLTVTDGDGVTDAVTSEVTPIDHLIVSIGDSVASGEGNPQTAGSWAPFASPTWNDTACHRSDLAGPARAAAALEDADPRSSVTFIHLACSGAAMLDTPETAGAAPTPPDDPDTGGVLDPYRGIEPGGRPARPSQVEQMVAAVGGRHVDALLLSVGANDIRFSEVVQQCIASAPLDPLPCHRSGTATRVAARLGTLPERYALLDEAFGAAGIETDRVFITEYFDPTIDDLGLPDLRCVAETEAIGSISSDVSQAAGVVASGATNPVVAGIAKAVGFFTGLLSSLTEGGVVTDDETAWARGAVVSQLNQAVRSAAQTYGWNHVDGIAERFDRHGYCASDPWIVTLGESLSRQHDQYGAFHPNAAGHAVYGDAIISSVGQEIAPAPTPDAFPAHVALGDVYVTVAGNEQVWASIVRDTGGVPLVLDVRKMDRLALGEGYQGPGIPAAEEASAVTPWWQFSVTSGVLPTAMLGQITLAENVGVRSVAVVQAPVDGRRIVADRPSVVLATIDARIGGPQTIDVTTEVTAEDDTGAIRTVLGPVVEQVTVVPGRNDVLLPVDDTFTLAAGERASANVTVSEAVGPGGDSSDDFATSSSERIPTATVTRPLHAIFLPGGVGSGSVGCPSVARAAQRMGDHASAAMPVGGDGIAVDVACTAIAIDTQDEPGVLDVLSRLDHLARLTAQDVIVAVVPAGWLQLAAGGAVGVAAPGMRAVVIEASAPAEALAHEISHTYGVDHRAGVHAEGARIPTRTAPRGIDWMTPVAGPPTWTGGATWDELVALIGGPDRTPQLPDPAHHGVWVRGTVERLPDGSWVVGPATWTPADPLAGSTGQDDDTDLLSELSLERLTVEQISATGDVLASDPVPAHPASGMFAAGTAAVPDPAGALFAALVELDPDATTLRLLHGATVVDERPVGAAPTVEVTAPAAGRSVARGATLTVAWSANDPDSSDLTADILVGADGDPWKPLAVGLDATAGAADVTVPADLDGTAVRVRVVVSDGVRSGQGDSDPFTVDGGGSTLTELVAFARDGRLYTMRPDGSDVTPIDLPTEHGYDFSGYAFDDVAYRTPSWGADGRLYFSSNYSAPQFDPMEGDSPPVSGSFGPAIFSSLPDGSDLRKVSARGSTTRCPQTSPDGSRIVHYGFVDGSTEQGVVVAAPDGTGATMILTGGGTIPAGALNATWPAPESDVWAYLSLEAAGMPNCPRWSPDGTEVAVLVHVAYYHTFPTRPYPSTVRSNDVPFVIDVASGAVRVLADVPRYGLRTYPDGGTSFDPYDSWTGLDWYSDGDLHAERNEHSGLCGYPYSCTSTYRRLRLDSSSGAATDLGTHAGAFAWKVSPVGDDVLYGRGWETGGGSNLIVIDLTAATVEHVPAPPDHSADTDFDWGFAETGGGPTTELVAVPRADPTAPAETGGPYHAVRFEPITLDAGSSGALDSPDGTTALAEWDLDGDGVFGEPEDATGIRPTVTFAETGTFPIRVRITSEKGTTFSEPTDVVVRDAPPNEPLPPVDGADRPIPPAVAPTDLSVEVPADESTEITLTPTGTATRFVVLETSGLTDRMAVSSRVGTPFPGEPVTTGPDGVLVVAPVPGWTGTASFTVANAADATLTATVEVTVIGNQPPVASDDVREVSVGQVTSFDATELLANDVDPDGTRDGLQVVAVRGATNGDAWIDPSGTVFVAPDAVGSGQAEIVVADPDGALAVSVLQLSVVPGPTPPGAPTGLTASPGDGRVVLAWRAPESSSPITGYEVQVRRPGESWGPTTPVPPRLVESVTPGPTATSAIVGDLTNGTTYEFRVAARSELGVGGFSAAVSATPQAATPTTTTPSGPTTTPSGPTTTPAGPTTTPATSAPVTSTTRVPVGILPRTGSDSTNLSTTAVIVLAAGVVTWSASRRRRPGPRDSI